MGTLACHGWENCILGAHSSSLSAVQTGLRMNPECEQSCSHWLCKTHSVKAYVLAGKDPPKGNRGHSTLRVTAFPVLRGGTHEQRGPPLCKILPDDSKGSGSVRNLGDLNFFFLDALTRAVCACWCSGEVLRGTSPAGAAA